jgi:hypothetical protein
MEGETQTTINQQLDMYKEKVLPTLDNNIKSGNSLVDFDFCVDQVSKTNSMVKPFNWEIAFPQVFQQKGFDCIIGNPPYVRLNLLDSDISRYYLKKFTATCDSYSIFIEKAFDIVKPDGLFSFIVPSSFIKGVNYQSLRDLINRSVSEFTYEECGDGVFENVQMPTTIFISKKGDNPGGKDFFTNETIRLFHKIDTISLESLTTIRRGLELGKDRLHDNSDIACITGGNIDSYVIKSVKYIDKQTFQDFKKDQKLFSSSKIMVRETGNKLFATIDDSGLITTRSIYNIIQTEESYSLSFILGIINSDFFIYYFKEFIAPKTGVFPKIRIAQLKKLPIPKIDFENTAHKKTYDEIARLVEGITALQEECNKIDLPTHVDQLNSNINFNKKQINNLVYELYSIDKAERKLVEESI